MSQSRRDRVQKNHRICIAEAVERRTMLSGSLAFTVQPATSNVGTLIDSPTGIQVSSVNAGGGGSNDSITLSLGANPGGAVLGGTVTEAAVNGVANFPSVWINVARNGYSLVATDTSNPAIQPVASASFNINALPRVNPLLTLSQEGYGQNPTSPLAADASGNLYGTTLNGGLYGQGVIYELSGVNHTAYTGLASFQGLPLNQYQYTEAPMVIDSSGNLYGVHGNTVFELSANHLTLTTLATFAGLSGPTQYKALTGLTIDGSGNLYGTTGSGGASDSGTVFEITASHQFINLLSFTGSSGAYVGQTPDGPLSIDANGNLYGTTEYNSSTTAGVPSTFGTVFELAANHTTFTTLVTFTGGGGAYPGAHPQGSLAIDKQGNIFGTTAGGSLYNVDISSAIFELAANHTTFTSLLSFTGSSGAYPGTHPQSLAIDSAGNLYGATGDEIFKLASNHTTFSTLQTFYESGQTPVFGLSVAVSVDGNGNLYATTAGGGTAGLGSATEFSGTGDATASTLSNFDQSNPVRPQGSLAVDSSGNLFGTTTNSIFELSAPNYSTYTTLHIFGAAGTTAGTNGLVIDRNGNLYGTTASTVFEFSADHTTYTTLVTFTGSSGGYLGLQPNSLTLDGSGDIFGTTTFGGTYVSGDSYIGNGTIFEISADHKTFTTLLTFTGTTGSYPGAYPLGGVTLDTAGDLFGTTGWTGDTPSASIGNGTIFELAANHTTFTTLHFFDSYSRSSRASGTMVIDANGNLFGTSMDLPYPGSIFELDSGGSFHFLHFFKDTTDFPAGNLAIDRQGNLYGANTANVIYELSADHSIFTALVPSNGTTSVGNPGAVADAIGNIFVTVPEGGVYQQGSVTEIAADGVSDLNAPSGVTTIAPPPGVAPRAGATFDSITISAGATVATAPSTGAATVLITSSLSIAASAGAWTGTLDLGNNDLDIIGGSLATTINQIQQAYKGGTWTGAGISSSSAAAARSHLTALGIIQNNQSGSALFTLSNLFDGTTPGPADTLVKYTYYGDTNLDGNVDGSDYSRIDSGYLSHATGWFNGDFNYDGIVDGSDYTLIDNAFNTQGASLAAQIAPVGGVKSSPPRLAATATFLFAGQPEIRGQNSAETPSVAALIFDPQYEQRRKRPPLVRAYLEH